MKNLISASMGILALLGASANAAAFVTFTEEGGNTIAELSGTLDLTGVTDQGLFASANTGFVDMNNARVGFGGAGENQRLYSAVGPSVFGTGGNIDADSVSGDIIFLLGATDSLWLPADFTGGELSGTMTFLGVALEAFGFTDDSYVYTLTNGDTLTVLVSNEVPVPAALPLFGAGLAGLTFLRKRRSV
ncbi:PEP-CTERM sorting domain-containing protein [Parvularcula maris]|uniref:VPLPA-CTERM sorting domain-containing protein n=1 Tax=Parvularcula maris TaxID=2965077 RepID=A0A9X2RKR8_9PROT|nr:VPLPA-CTERM sorting domain-containing protein [Parvularcula maris]MCQ8185882.1 VPLPA-CTERM sorting domain-containing protein [Parvularcula maris]